MFCFLAGACMMIQSVPENKHNIQMRATHKETLLPYYTSVTLNIQQAHPNVWIHALNIHYLNDRQGKGHANRDVYFMLPSATYVGVPVEPTCR